MLLEWPSSVELNHASGVFVLMTLRQRHRATPDRASADLPCAPREFAVELIPCLARAVRTRVAESFRQLMHRLLSADGDSSDRQDSADRPAHSRPRQREYSNILMVPTSAPGLLVRGMGIATSPAGHRPTRLPSREGTQVRSKPWSGGSINN